MGVCGDMADRDPLHQPIPRTGGMGSGALLYNPPLLPFEKQIIQLIGCSEQEYRYLVAEAIRRAGPRPAAYELVPDVRNDFVTPLLISLAVGLASSAVSYVLAPKPKAPSAIDNAIKQRNLGNIVGASRFTPTFGFDSQAELADYGEPIPIVFGRYTGQTGGMLVTPKLVWSRMFSYGTQQGAKLLFVVGEQGVDGGQKPQGILQPDLNGIFLGNGPLDAIYANSFAFYWKRNNTASGVTRLQSNSFLYGTRGTPESGDPETSDDIFSCPTARGQSDYGFSSAHSLSNNSEFGCFAPIPNGTVYRVNWRVITIPRLAGQEDDPGNNLRWERVKIAGDDNGNANTSSKLRQLYQAGTGRNYSRRMGITALNGVGVSDGTGVEERSVSNGDVIQFTISAQQIPENYYGGFVKVDDINSALNEERIAADDALQIGELFMISRTVWQVIKRRLQQWRPESNQDQVVELRCIDDNRPFSDKIGVVAQAALTRHYVNDRFEDIRALAIGPAFYPLMRFAKAVVRNTRPCEVTEIGIKSNVYQRLNGLCNFQSIPSPDELRELEQNRITLNTGTVSAYIRRASVFTIFLRPAGLDQNDQPYAWQPLNIRFAVVGNSPVDVYNFIRLKHAESRQYEFQFIPKNGADLRNSPENAPIWLLNGASSAMLAGDFETTYGRFGVYSVGSVVTKLELQKNVEFAAKATVLGRRVTQDYPESLGIDAYLPPAENRTTRVDSLIRPDNPWYTIPSGFTEGKNGAFGYEVLGLASASPVGIGQTITKRVREYLPNNRWIDIEYRARKVYIFPETREPNFSGERLVWDIFEYNPKGDSGGWQNGQEIIISRTTSGGNPYRNVPGQGTISVAGVRLRVGNVSTIDQAQGRIQGALEEILGPARNYNVGQRRTAYLTYNANGKYLRFAVSSIVYSDPYHWTGVDRLWAANASITAEIESSTTTNWNAGDTFDMYFQVSATNPFAQYYRNRGGVGLRFKVQSLRQVEIVSSQFTAERIFEGQSQYADLSLYGSLVEKSNANAPEHEIVYVNEMVSNQTVPSYDRMTLCGLVLKASRNFSSLDQIRTWLPNGLHVKRFHPDDAALPFGPSNLFSDLVFYLLTDSVGGMGRVLNMSLNYTPLINTDDFIATAKFLKANRLFFDGVIGTSSNLRQFIADTAPFFLCNFVISDGKFSVLPALPTTASGEISLEPVPISQIFTAGNILEDSFELEYLGAEERKPFQAVVRYREERKNQLPKERNIVARWNTDDEFLPLESFDMTQYCTGEHHARMVAKFFLSIRKRVTHTIRFRTTPYGLNLAPGQYIKVVTEASPYSAARNGVIDASGNITSATALSDGQYSILYYKSGSSDVEQATMTISGGKVAEQALWSVIFTLLEATTSQNIYMVEQLTLADDSTVQITASEFPCDDNLSSLIAQDVKDGTRFIFEL